MLHLYLAISRSLDISLLRKISQTIANACIKYKNTYVLLRIDQIVSVLKTLVYVFIRITRFNTYYFNTHLLWSEINN